jgi:chemotaxis protein methyltransferase CheR
MHDHEFHQLLDRFELSRSGYRKVCKGVKKRIGRHIQQMGCRNLGAYLAVIADNVEARDQCRRLLTVSISRFFRDRQLWQDLEQKVFPELVQSENEEIRIWSAGCACGEEVYSTKIIWDRIQNGHIPPKLLHITATDLNPLYLEKARGGCYSPSSLKDVPDSLRSIYFAPVKGAKRYSIQPFLKDNINWQTSDFFSGAPGRGYHVIFLRNNLLTYYRGNLQQIAFIKILESLANNGFLIIGAHESLPIQTPELVPFDSCRYVFRRKVAYLPPMEG